MFPPLPSKLCTSPQHPLWRPHHVSLLSPRPAQLRAPPAPGWQAGALPPADQSTAESSTCATGQPARAGQVLPAGEGRVAAADCAARVMALNPHPPKVCPRGGADYNLSGTRAPPHSAPQVPGAACIPGAVRRAAASMVPHGVRAARVCVFAPRCDSLASLFAGCTVPDRRAAHAHVCHRHSIGRPRLPGSVVFASSATRAVFWVCPSLYRRKPLV